MKEICIVGTGGFGREVLSLLNDLDKYDNVAAFLEPDHIWEEKWKDKTLMGKQVLPMSFANEAKHQITIGVASNAIRRKTLEQLPAGIEYISLIHPSVQISRWVEVGRGAIITAGCILTCDIKLGDFVQLNVSTTICHDCRIGDFFTTAPGVHISGNVIIDDDVYFGTASATKQGISICKNVFIGMGAMVTRDITEPGTYIGVPAKKMMKLF